MTRYVAGYKSVRFKDLSTLGRIRSTGQKLTPFEAGVMPEIAMRNDRSFTEPLGPKNPFYKFQQIFHAYELYEIQIHKDWMAIGGV